MKTNHITIIKFGGSIITDKSKPYTPNLPIIKRLISEIKKVGIPVIVVHGQGSFAHTSAKKYGGKKGYSSLWGIAKVFRDAMEMNRIVMDAFMDAKLPAVSFRPNSLFMAKSGKIFTHNLEVISEALRQGLTPVLYGDVIMDKTWKTTIFSGETSTYHLVNFLSKKKIKVDKIIQVGATDGIYDNNNKTIRNITTNNYEEIKNYLFEAKTTDVTGGMRHKVEEAILVAKKGVATYIINGSRKGELSKLLMSKSTQLMTCIK
ncbi:MAG: hypothetical protein COX79_02945 [Candidatus Levybacteria bacterium CG_4_10_14_0_2_um_filter_36_16]|nr:MAG: hypothetical protein AUK12_01165 [Candidatus Levybacteria bacterium CG2_30_37_29]PIR79592.1 MAG: hypothetical protein COU26_00365 [Candidatus Levybacteria bacterium CG10_big_fil_rev_8_21_14_0_10_36_30]PIZ97282.1 MAG: hypothetical protein COX79_02945 [Candidatus Levybacteria bacterium CG_4_10_14_0_2_um_filter_36_16]PJA90938.1 MAG: hypothetical protein CO136_00025 [Candidatus Levybacteria bacterium CG_4_9_14_3_um_filter_36_7]